MGISSSDDFSGLVFMMSKVKIDKKMFVKIMTELMEAHRLEEKVANSIRQYQSICRMDFPNEYGLVVTHEFACQDLLAIIFHDTENGWIDYFCNELNYGKLGPVDEENNSKLQTIDDLWDVLINELKTDDSFEYSFDDPLEDDLK